MLLQTSMCLHKVMAVRVYAERSQLEDEPEWELLAVPDMLPCQEASSKPGTGQALPTSVASKFARLLQLQHRGAALVGA